MKKRASTVEFELLVARLCDFAQDESSPNDSADNRAKQDLYLPGTGFPAAEAFNDRDDSAEFFRDSAAVSRETEEFEDSQACPAAIGGAR